MTRVFLMAALLACVSASAEEEEQKWPDEIWKCYSEHDWDKEDILVLLNVWFDGPAGVPLGRIEVEGTSQLTQYWVKGQSRRWDFGEYDGTGFPYSFVIHSDGMGYYYDFSKDDSARPSHRYFCYQDETSTN